MGRPAVSVPVGVSVNRCNQLLIIVGLIEHVETSSDLPARQIENAHILPPKL